MKDNLTHLQYIAIEGEVGLALGSAPHKDEMMYRMYLMLKNVPKKYKPYLISAIKENVDLEEEEIERIVLESENEEPPVWLWINRTISDIKIALVLGDYSMIPRELRLPVKKKELREKTVASAFISFIRKVALVHSNAAKSLVEAIMNDDDLEFLQLACFALLGEIIELQQAKKPKPVTEDFLTEATFDPREPLSFINEKKAIEEPVDDIKSILETIEESDARARRRMPKRKKEIVEYETPENGTKIVESEVVKVFKDEGVSTKIRSFSTEEEAVAFVEDIKTKYPEILAKTPIIIIKKEID